MKYETNEYILEYNECDKEYINELIKYFEQEKENIFKFFSIEKLNKKLIIKLYDTIDEFAKYRNNNLYEWSVGNMDVDDNYYYIHMLSYKEFIKRKGHENQKIDYYFKTIIHEFIHNCHEDIESARKSLIWVREGIACLLSHQYDNSVKRLTNCTLDDLLNDKRVGYINYYVLFDYALNIYGEEYIRKLVSDSGFAKEEITKLYNEYRSKNDYYITTNKSSEYRDRVANIINNSKKTIFDFFEKDEEKTNFNIYIYATQEELRKKLVERGFKEDPPHMCACQKDEDNSLNFYEPVDKSDTEYTKDKYDIFIYHELIHGIQHHIYGKQPEWLMEGIAKYLDGTYQKGIKFLLDNYISKDKTNNNIPSMNELINEFGWHQDIYDSYDYAYLIVSYLIETEGKSGFVKKIHDNNYIKELENSDIINESINYYVNKYNIKVSEIMKEEYLKVTNPLEFQNFMDKYIRYGFVDNKGKIYNDPSSKEWEENWYSTCIVQDGDGVLNTCYGTCWDQVELERKWFSDNNYNFKTIFICFELNEPNNLPTHTFLIYEDNNKYYWFEHAYDKYKGIHEFNSYEEAIKYVEDKQLEYAIETDRATEDDRKLMVAYEYAKPKINCNVDEYIKHVSLNRCNTKNK